jgi:hypothetical protein
MTYQELILQTEYETARIRFAREELEREMRRLDERGRIEFLIAEMEAHDA